MLRRNFHFEGIWTGENFAFRAVPFASKTKFNALFLSLSCCMRFKVQSQENLEWLEFRQWIPKTLERGKERGAELKRKEPIEKEHSNELPD